MNDRCEATTKEGSRCRLEGPADPDGRHWCHKHTSDPQQALRLRKERLAKRQRRKKALNQLPARLTALMAEMREDDFCDCCNTWHESIERLLREVQG